MFKPEQIIGRHYRIINQLGEGGMGQVYKALDINLGREVAIKFLLAEIARDEDVRNRFLNEGRVLATINHPAVINVYASDIEEAANLPFLVMEYVDGKSLNGHKKALRTQPTALISHFIQLFSGIHACHQKGIVHRDLKPENVLINKDGQLKIVDFGIAKTASRNTKTGIAIGTPYYMSPEQCMGKSNITSKTDVYAAGIMLSEILMGKVPFNLEGQASDPALAIALMHLNNKPDLSEITKLPEGSSFQALIERMLAKNPDDRPEIPDILEELKRISNRLKHAESGTAEISAVPANMIGEIYQIEKELGSGGMGKVYKAIDTSLNRTVAIKVLHEISPSNQSLIERFIKEGQTLATVGHRNVMGIYASARDKATGRPFLVMEYIEGKPLSELKNAINKDCRQAVPIMLQLAEGLAACHEHNIIHRDLKPSNIIITPEGLVKILDFGIAKTQTSLTKTGMTVGTPEYMSPEQCTGSKNISGKSDIYSLGIIFWELIFGTVPYHADASQNAELSIALKHIEATLPAQVAIPDMSMVPIIGLVRKMLDKDPNARPALRTIIETFEDYLSEHAPEAMPRSSTSRRSTSRSVISSLSQLVKESDQPTAWKKIAVPTLLAVILGGGLVYKFGFGSSKNTAEKEAIISKLIQSQKYNEARREIDDFSLTEEGRQKVPLLKKSLSQAMINIADEAEKKLDFAAAIDLYAQAISLDPANPRAALTLSRLQQEKEKHDRQKSKIESLNRQALVLLEIVEPASGTRELFGIMAELEKSGLASISAEIASTWKARFINHGEAALEGNPQKSLVYFNDLKRYFKDDEHLAELIKKAEKQSLLLEEQLAQTTMLNTLKSALEKAIDEYVPGQKPDFLCQQIQKVSELGDSEAADLFSQKLGEKIAREADVWIVNNPEKAIELFNSARFTCPTLTGIDSRLQLAQESLQAFRSSEEMKAERDALSQEISETVKNIAPPSDINELLEKIIKLGEYGQAADLVEQHRETLYQKYFNFASETLEKSPETAQKALKVCLMIKPTAPGLAEVEEKITRAINEAAEKAASIEKEKLQKKQESDINEVIAFIKKLKMPAEVSTALSKIDQIKNTYPQTDASEKLTSNLLTRIKSDLTTLEKNDPGKAFSLNKELLKVLPESIPMFSELIKDSDRLEKLAEKAREDAEIKAKAEAEAKARADEEARIKAEADAKTRAEAEAKAKIEAEAKAKADAEVRARQEAELKARQEAETKAAAKAKADEEARLKAEAETKEMTVGPQGRFRTIAEAVSAAKEGATIKVQAGTYNEQLLINKGITIQGESSARCIITSSRGPTITLTGPVKISGFTLTNTSSQPASTVLIQRDNPEVSGCVISNSTSAKAPDYVAAVEIAGGGAKVRQNQITGSKAMGINILGGTPQITGNTVSGCEIYGIWFNGNSQAKVTGNTIRSNGRSGVGIKAGGNPDFSDNTITANNENGMLIYADGKGKIENNRFIDNKLYGLEVWDAQPLTINKNLFEKNRKDAIYVRGKSAVVKLGQNEFKDNRGENVKNSGGNVSNY